METTPISARIICDSIAWSHGKRLTTMVLVYPRFIHSELMTYRSGSRNAASSRAVPVALFLEIVRERPAMPVWWGANQPGMSARAELEPDQIESAKAIVSSLRSELLVHVGQLNALGLHKQVANRYLEPFLPMTTVYTATDFCNLYAQRLHPDAQPEFQVLAGEMLKVMNESSPRIVGPFEWHLPFIQDQERGVDLQLLKQASVARCARVSYLNLDGTNPSIEKDQNLFVKLRDARPMHASPFEHVATPTGTDQRYANFEGWRQMRAEFPDEVVKSYAALLKYGARTCRVCKGEGEFEIDSPTLFEKCDACGGKGYHV